MNLSQPYYIEPRDGESHLELCGEWDYAYTDNVTDSISSLDWRLKTQIPNSVYWSLYESGILPHPYKECNSKLYHWVDEKVWYYRKTFALSEKNNFGDAFLCIDGAAYYSRVWLNGNLIGEHEGMFGGPFVEVGGELNFCGDNELVIEIKACNYGMKERWNSWNTDGSNRVIVPWNLARDSYTSNGDFIVLGLWRGVRIEFLPKLHISRPYLTTEDISNEQAKLHLKFEIADGMINELKVKADYSKGSSGYTRAYDNGLTGIKKDEKVNIRIELIEKISGNKVCSEEEEICLYDYTKSGINPEYYECQFYNKDIIIDNPKLWFPHDMGEPFLYTVKISLIKDSKMYDVHTFNYGIRTVNLEVSAGEQFRARWDKFQFVVNDKKIFLKGMNWMPIDFILKLDREEYKWTLELAKNVGIQLLRVWSGGGIPENDDFYELCDELGIMVWQDNLIANMDTPNWPQDILQAQVCMNLYRIRNHSSLVIHCGGNEFNPYSFGNAASMFVIERNISDLDCSRPFMRTTADKGSAHIYRDMEPTWFRHLYKQLPFLAESGIHSFPNIKSIRQLISDDEYSRPLSNIYSDEFKDKNPELLNHFTEYVPDRISRMLARASYITDIKDISLKDLVEATQLSSCEFYQIMIQAMRENYPVTTGIMPWVFKRAWATVGIQLVDGMGDPIAPYYYVKNSYKPLIVMVCLEHLTFATKEKVELPIKIINGNCEDISNLTLELQVLDPNMQVAYENTQTVFITSQDYQKTFNVDAFDILENYNEKFFFVRAAIKKDGEILSQSIYWPKCLERMKAKEARDKYRNEPQENFAFDKGPWLKKQVESTPKADLFCNIISVNDKHSRITIQIEIENISNNPAFPVSINIINDGTVCRLSDNYYFHNPKEIKKVELEVYNKSSNLSSLNIEISAWNFGKITKTIQLRGNCL